MSDTHIDSEEALAEFRSTLFSAGSLAPIIDANPATLINAPIGIGKSWLIDDLIDYYLQGAVYKLIVVLAGLTVSLLERRLIRHPVPGVVRLRPRPRQTAARSTHPGASTSSGGQRPGPNATSARTASTIGGASGRLNTAPACVTPGSYSEPTSISSTIAGSYRISGRSRGPTRSCS